MRINWYITSIISLIINVILIILIFFKSALNEILLDWYKTRKENKERKRVNLKKLRSLLYEYSASFFMYATYTLTFVRGNDASVNFIKPFLDESKKQYDSANKGLIELKPDLDKDIRVRIDGIMTEVTKLLLFASGAPKYLEGWETMSQNQFILKGVSTHQQCVDFIKDIETKLEN